MEEMERELSDKTKSIASFINKKTIWWQYALLSRLHQHTQWNVQKGPCRGEPGYVVTGSPTEMKYWHFWTFGSAINTVWDEIHPFSVRPKMHARAFSPLDRTMINWAGYSTSIWFAFKGNQTFCTISPGENPYVWWDSFLPKALIIFT